MGNNAAVAYSFLLYVLYVLLPLIPAILIFRLFPETKVTVSGPLQNLTVNATGAFAAYVVTVALGFFLVNNVEAQIQWTRLYAVEGVITDLAESQAFNSDRFYARYSNETSDAGGKFANRDYHFVLLLNHPVLKPEKIWLKYWDLKETGGIGAPPTPRSIPMELLATSSLQRFRLQAEKDQLIIVPETGASSFPNRGGEIRVEEGR
jgi:hypothetical protein